MLKKWTAEEERYLENNYESKMDKEIGAVLGRSVSSVALKRRVMGLDKPRGRKPKPKPKGPGRWPMSEYPCAVCAKAEDGRACGSNTCMLWDGWFREVWQAIARATGTTRGEEAAARMAMKTR